MNGILVYSDSKETALGLLAKARRLAGQNGPPISLAILGMQDGPLEEAAFSHGAQKAFLGEDPLLEHFDAQIFAQALYQIAVQSEADLILIGSTQQGREVAPRLAQKLSAGCLTDAIGLSLEGDQLTVERRALGGNTVSAKIITSAIQVIAVMPGIYEASENGPGIGEVIKVSLDLPTPATRLVERKPKESGAVNIEDAEILVCIGRGVANQDDLSLIERFASAIGGKVACTRPISHENHWLSEDQMIGISGKVLNPALYLGVGVSGQIQHTVGIMDAKVIVAINKDPNAPIFNVADYGIVGDLYDLIPQIIEHLGGEGK